MSTISAAGETNLAPFSFFNVCSPSPPVLGFSCGPKGDNHNEAARMEKDTERNIRATSEFVVNITPESLIKVGTRQGRRHGVDLLSQIETRPVGRLGRANYVRLREIETRLRRDGPN